MSTVRHERFVCQLLLHLRAVSLDSKPIPDKKAKLSAEPHVTHLVRQGFLSPVLSHSCLQKPRFIALDFLAQHW